MSDPLQLVVAILFFVMWLFALPAIAISGWIQWGRKPSDNLLSFLGFTLGTVSLALDFGMTMYAHRIGGFPFYDPLLRRICLWGIVISLIAIVLAMLGLPVRGPLRWRAVLLSGGMLAVWFMVAMSE